ncbi:ubiquitinyl hydrolase 1 [Opisthorchis viverrini]|uniref:Ubiquitinyl hydrolase 1 n=2 Tax=Opisthorchis viverrini TaxID=6198 RepID=A0A1S8X8A5_OPIVI|nr:hypothetical protein T265_07767 [Opisthorchis viverrini]KER24625.1 hypothetical protein T265_07767 [Opisthorchis viverrini]OON22960.1 ubiquitinyl hydrolase 1 [Opisthorchis viverrini]
MPVFKINIKWQKERYKDVECNTDESPEKFKAVLFSLTGVPPSRQKVMMPGKILGDENYDGIKLKDGATVMLMGTADEIPPTEQAYVSTEEPATTNECTLRLPFGLVNLGNTCYMNAAIQLLYSIPEVRTALKIFSPPQSAMGLNSPESLVINMRLLFNSMDKAEQPVIPAVFVTCLRNVCPQFATRLSNEGEKGNDGSLLSMLGARFAQQDANECWVELMHALQRVQINPCTVTSLPEIFENTRSLGSWNLVERYFTGHLLCKLTCTETEEEATETRETFTQLSCFINQDVKFLHTGIRNGFEGTVTKHSASLGRNAVYKKTSVLTRLPAYLSIHFVRFFYKEDKHLNAKILKDVKFPLELDLFSFCSEALQKDLIPIREKMRQQADYEVHSFSKEQKTATSTKDSKCPNPAKNPELFEPYSLPDDVGSNNSGFYELMGVLSHQGRTSSSGHYVAWVKVEENWIKFDDDTVTCVTPEDILRLSGGGDWHCAYVLLYGPKRVLKSIPPIEPASSTVQMEVGQSVKDVHGGDRTD